MSRASVSLSRLNLEHASLTPTRKARAFPPTKTSAAEERAWRDREWLRLNTEGEVGPHGRRVRLGYAAIARRFGRRKQTVIEGIRRARAASEALADAKRPPRDDAPFVRPPRHRANASVPAELAYFVPEPDIGLLGCRPFAPLAPGQPCDVCDDKVEDIPSKIEGEPATVVICLQCHRMDPRWEPLCGRQRSEAAAAEDARTRAERDREWLDERSKSPPKRDFSEVERRVIWLGYADAGFVEAGVTNPRKACRDYLARIGQPPDWSKVLDAWGEVVGEFDHDPARATYWGSPHADPGEGTTVWNAAPADSPLTPDAPKLNPKVKLLRKGPR